jgi:hypothetical protein
VRTACITFLDRRGGLYGHVIQAKTLLEAVSTAIDWFRSGFWRGPRPTRDTVFEVGLIPEGRWGYVVKRWSGGGKSTGPLHEMVTGASLQHSGAYA